MIHVKFFAGPNSVNPSIPHSIAMSAVGRRVEMDLQGCTVTVSADYERPVPCVLAVTTYYSDDHGSGNAHHHPQHQP